MEKVQSDQILIFLSGNRPSWRIYTQGQIHDSYICCFQIRTSRAPPGEEEVTYDEHGNIVAMMRLSVDKLPTHRYTFMDRLSLFHGYQVP